MLRILFFFIVCKIHFFGFIEALDSKGILRTLKKVVHQPYNALTLQKHFRYATNNILLTLQVHLVRSIGHQFICKFASIP